MFFCLLKEKETVKFAGSQGMGTLLWTLNLSPESEKLSTVLRVRAYEFMESRSCLVTAASRASLRRMSWSSGLYLGVFFSEEWE